MAKLTGMNAAHKRISKAVVKTIQKDVPQIIVKQMNSSIEKGVDSMGVNFPDKKESTKKSYNRKGYNTEKWLIASGKGKKVVVEKIDSGIRLSPIGKNYMKYIQQSKAWFSLSQKTITDIINKIKKRI